MRWEKDDVEKPVLKLLGKVARHNFDEMADEPLAGAIFQWNKRLPINASERSTTHQIGYS